MTGKEIQGPVIGDRSVRKNTKDRYLNSLMLHSPPRRTPVQVKDGTPPATGTVRRRQESIRVARQGVLPNHGCDGPLTVRTNRAWVEGTSVGRENSPARDRLATRIRDLPPHLEAGTVPLKEKTKVVKLI